MSYETYPKQLHQGEDHPLYFIEYYDREDGSKVTWTLFKKNFICSKAEWDMETSNYSRQSLSFMSREGHPYNLFGDEVLPDQCIPNRKWLEWMVDALNEKVLNDLRPRSSTLEQPLDVGKVVGETPTVATTRLS